MVELKKMVSEFCLVQKAESAEEVVKRLCAQRDDVQYLGRSKLDGNEVIIVMYEGQNYYCSDYDPFGGRAEFSPWEEEEIIEI